MKVDEGGAGLGCLGSPHAAAQSGPVLHRPHETTPTHGSRSWAGKLALSFAHRRGGTRLASSVHEGPLRVQRPFFPEGDDGPCHVYVLHPPGGVVTGDRLSLEVELGAHTHALLTTPGANKLYRTRTGDDATIQPSALSQRFLLGQQAIVEWLPGETIAFDGARATLRTEVQLAESATYVGWELLCLGRPASAERFTRGELGTALSLRRDDRLQYLERGLYRGDSALLREAWGLGGKPVWGTFLVASPRAQTSWVEVVRAALASDHDRVAATLVSGVLLVRYLGDSTREARLLFERALSVLRPLYAGRAAVPPRIWST